MTEDETAILLAMFQANWPYFKADEDAVMLWSLACSDMDAFTAQAAAERIIAIQERPPVIATFRAEYDHCRRSHTDTNAIDASPCDCDHGFVQGPDLPQMYRQGRDGPLREVMVSTSRPCERCNRPGFERWERDEKIAAAKRRNPHKGDDRTYVANPVEGLASVRESLAQAVPWSRPDR